MIRCTGHRCAKAVALSAPAVVSAFHNAYPGLCAEQGWGYVWLLGPTQSTWTQLGKPRP